MIERVLKSLTQLDEKAKPMGPQGTIGIPVDWTDQVEHNLVAAEKLIAEARVFFTEANIKRLKSIPLADKAVQGVRALRWGCDKGMVKSG